MDDVWCNLPEVALYVSKEFRHADLLEGKKDFSFQVVFDVLNDCHPKINLSDGSMEGI